jgi:hypothetical protein
MLEEINKIGEIDSVGDILDFKLSIKTLIILAMLGGIGATIFVVLLFGGVNNTIDYANGIIEATKKSIVINKDKKPVSDQSSQVKTE